MPHLRLASPAARRRFARGVAALALAASATTSVSAADGEPAPGASESIVSQVRERAADLVITALNFLGVPYRRGGDSADTGFDCSGFTRYIFEQSLGLELPRRVDQQAKAAGLRSIERDALQPGDLVFFDTLKHRFSHVGIYLGEGKFIHAPRSGAAVRVEDMTRGYWSRRFDGARRAEENATASN
jgi:cell wall-associated NlpC family hydrolase